jgi:uncharacterized membrane protein
VISEIRYCGAKFSEGTVVLIGLGEPLAALSIILGLNGLAAGAATVGCASNMVQACFRYQILSGIHIWIPAILTSAILGPIATMVFKMENNASGGGMGTSGLVGQLMTWDTMIDTQEPAVLLFKIILLHFILPAVLTLLFSEFMRKKNWIKPGDMALDL